MLNNSMVPFIPQSHVCLIADPPFSRHPCLILSRCKGKFAQSQNIQMKWASRFAQLAMFSNLRNERRRGCGGGGSTGGGLVGEAQRSGWVWAWRFVTMAHADVAVVLPKATTVPIEWKGGNENLVWDHTPPPCVSSGCWHVKCSLGKRLSSQWEGDDVGGTRAKGNPSLWVGMSMEITKVEARKG